MTCDQDDLSKHIFLHYGFTYVVDFTKRKCFVIDTEDEEEPIATIDIQKNIKGWDYKSSGLTEDAPFIENSDDEWSDKMNYRYMEYIKMLIV